MVHEIATYADGKILEWKWSSNSPLMPKLFWTSCYLVDQLLIDCGAPGSVEEMNAFLTSLPPDQVPTQCFLTHAHEDHVGTGSLLVDKWHIPVYAPPESIERLLQGWSYRAYRKITWGETGVIGFSANPYPGDTLSTEHYSFHILPLPGHAPDLYGLIEQDQGWAFVGDLLQPQYQQLFGRGLYNPIDPVSEDIQILRNPWRNCMNSPRESRRFRSSWHISRFIKTGKSFAFG